MKPYQRDRILTGRSRTSRWRGKTPNARWAAALVRGAGGRGEEPRPLHAAGSSSDPYDGSLDIVHRAAAATPEKSTLLDELAGTIESIRPTEQGECAG